MKAEQIRKIIPSFFISIILIITFIFSSCTSPAAQPTSPTKSATPTPTPKQQWPNPLTIGTPTGAGSVYFCATAISQMIQKYMNVSSAPQVFGGSLACQQAIGDGKVEIGFNTAQLVASAFRGKDEFAGKGNPQIRVIFGGPVSCYITWLRADSNIYSFTDLKGKKVLYARPGDLIETKRIWDGYLEAYGMTYKDFALAANYTDESQISTGIQAKTVDAGQTPATIVGTVPMWAELSRTTPLRILNVPKDKLQYVADKKFDKGVLQISVLPKGRYNGQDEDVNLLSQNQNLMCTKDLPEDWVYNFLKTVWDDHIAEFKALHPNLEVYVANNTIGITYVPFHSGAIKYFKEKGLWTAQNEKTQQDLLAGK